MRKVLSKTKSVSEAKKMAFRDMKKCGMKIINSSDARAIMEFNKV